MCRLDPISTKFIKYNFAVLHSSFLYYSAECTVSMALHTYNTLKGRKTGKAKALTISRGICAQVIISDISWGICPRQAIDSWGR